MSAARVLSQLGPLPKVGQEELATRLAEAQPTQSDVGPVYRQVFHSSKTQALRLAEAFAATLPDIDHHRQLFQSVALRSPAERRTLLDGYRKAGQDRWVVHAIGQLPTAQGRSLMKDFSHHQRRQARPQGNSRGAPLPR